jgi:hypothetical protein
MNKARMPLLVGALLASLCATATADVSLTDRQALGPRVKQARKDQRTASSAAMADSNSLIDASGLEWFVNSNITFSTSSSASGAVSEASYTGPVQATTVSGGLTSSTLSDAFDGYNTLCVSLTGATGPCGTGDPDYVVFNQNGPATLEAGGRQVALASQAIGDLTVSRKVYVPATDSFARWLNVFRNDGAAPVTFNAILANNLGSDSNTVLVTTSDGDAIPELTDKWVTTFQNYSGTTSSDPRLGHVLQGAGAPVALAAVSFMDGDDGPYWSYTLTLAPGETGIIMNFAVAQPSKAAAAAKAAELAAAPVAALASMTADELGAVRNFDLGGGSVKGDFNGDGTADVLWQNQTTGNLYAWLMSGTTAASGASFTPAGLSDKDWQLRAIADFDGDGDPDLLWHNQKTGALYFWYMNATTVETGAFLSASMADTRWQVRGAEDFSGDGRPDLLWHNQVTGQLYAWFLGTAAPDARGILPVTPTPTVVGGSFLSPAAVADLNWQVRGVADLDGNAIADLLWHNQATGALYAWFMGAATMDRVGSGAPGVASPTTTVVSASFLTPASLPDLTWQIRQLADFNGDGRQDILWRNTVTGQLYVWYLGTGSGDTPSMTVTAPAVTVVGAAFLTPSALADGAWQILPR